MYSFRVALVASVVLFSPTIVEARNGHRHFGSHYVHSGSHRGSNYCLTCSRDSYGRIARSSATREEFLRSTGYPHGRTGYVVDHVLPLKRGGDDSPYNMQSQTKEDAKAKDRWE